MAIFPKILLFHQFPQECESDYETPKKVTEIQEEPHGLNYYMVLPLLNV
jgi:hypothetical protein